LAGPNSMAIGAGTRHFASMNRITGQRQDLNGAAQQAQENDRRDSPWFFPDTVNQRRTEEAEQRTHRRQQA
jgi:hypothetical protein